MNHINEVIVPKKRFEIGTIWLTGHDEDPFNGWFLYDMVESDAECVEIWIRKKDEPMD